VADDFLLGGRRCESKRRVMAVRAWEEPPTKHSGKSPWEVPSLRESSVICIDLSECFGETTLARLYTGYVTPRRFESGFFT
jgi:hypothetical protein